MPASIGVNLRVTGHCRQGGRKYMEDFFSVAYQQTEDEKDLEYAFFGIYDGHGGGEAATFAKEHLMESIVRQKNFWSDKDEDVLKAIKEGYIATHYAMWKEQEKWPKTASGLPSTAGTTASVAFIRRGKIYIGHVGDSGIILGYQEPGNGTWKARPLTKDHKPENENEMMRIAQCGGKVVKKSGVPRVVWNRPRIGHKGPVRRSTPIDEIPFLAVARSLGDLWSYNSALDEFVVSPDPDTCCIPIDANTFRCLIFGTDGLWNMISPASAVSIVQVAEQHNERTVLAATETNQQSQQQQQQGGQQQMGRSSKVWINPSKCLVEKALERWSSTRMRADNTSVITLMLDPPGPPRAEVIKSQRFLSENRTRQQQHANPSGTQQNTENATQPGQSHSDQCAAPPPPAYPETGLEIVTMYGEEPSPSSPQSLSVPPSVESSLSSSSPPQTIQQSDQTQTPQPQQSPTLATPKPAPDENKEKETPSRRYTEEYLDKVHREVLNSIQNKEPNQTEVVSSDGVPEKPPAPETIQINEVSSSSSEKSAVDETPPCTRCTRSHDAARRAVRGGVSSRKASAKSGRSSSESPKRKLRQSKALATRRAVASSKREHSDPEILRADSVNSRLAAGPSSTEEGNEPPQKLRRSRSLGPRDFTLRSCSSVDLKSLVVAGRCLRDRDRASQGRHPLINTVIASTSTFRRLTTAAATSATTRSFTPVKSLIQTRNRVKRLGNK